MENRPPPKLGLGFQNLKKKFKEKTLDLKHVSKTIKDTIFIMF
jgi:hypothetical protein